MLGSFFTKKYVRSDSNNPRTVEICLVSRQVACSLRFCEKNFMFL